MKKLVRIFLICLFVIVVLVAVAVTGLYFYIKNFDMNAARPKIIEALQTALGRPVDIADMALGLSLSDGLSFQMKGLRVSEDAAFSTKDFLTVDAASLKVSLLGIFRSRQLSVSGITLSSPKVQIIRDKDGNFNFMTLAALRSGPQVNPPAGPQKNSAAAGAAALAALVVQDITLDKGTLLFEDRMMAPALRLTLNDVDLQIKDLSLLRSFPFTGKVNLAADAQNVSFAGRAKINLSGPTLGAGPVLELTQTKAQAALERMDIKKLQQLTSALEALRFKGKLKGTLEADISSMTIAQSGVTAVTLTARLKDVRFESGFLKVPAEGVQLTAEIADNKATISDASLALGKGRVAFSGEVDDIFKTQGYDFSFDAKDVDLEKIVDQSDQETALYGFVASSAKINGQGLEALTRGQLSGGQVSFDLKDGKLTNINVLRIVLDKVQMIPDLVEKLQANLPEKYQKILDEKDTTLKNITFRSSIRDGLIDLSEITVATEVFSILGKGTMGMDLSANIDCRIAIPQDLSQSMIQSVEELKFLSEDSGEIMIPLKITGKVPDELMFLPDLEYLGKKFLRTEGRQQIEKALDKVFNKGSGQDPNAPEGQGPKSPEAQIIGNILDSILR